MVVEEEEASVVVATTAMHAVFDKSKNLRKYMKFIDEAAEKGAKLTVFPEQSLQGYLHNVAQFRSETVKYHCRNAERVPEGKSVQALIDKAKAKHMYIVWGMTEWAPDEHREALYNTTVLVGPDGFVGKYRKVHQPIGELHIYRPGSGWTVHDIGFAKVGTLICYDKAFPESCRELALQGADIMIMSTAWPLCSIGADPETDYNAYVADIWDRARAAENQAWFISSNQVGVTGEHEFFGNSRIVYPNGRVCAELPYREEGLLTKALDVRAEIIKARTLDFHGLNMMKDRRPTAYKHITQEVTGYRIQVPIMSPRTSEIL